MNRRTLAAVGAAALLLAFGGAAWLYQSRQAAEIGAHDGPPLVREHSPVLGSQKARVSIVEFFDPG